MCQERLYFTVFILTIQVEDYISSTEHLDVQFFFFICTAEINDPYPRSKYHSLILLLPHLSRINLFLTLFLIYVCALLYDKQIARILMMRLIVYKHWVSLQKC